MNNDDEQWMQRALKLAENGRGRAEPNPLVGAVVVRENRVVGEGWHERFGFAHAEINAIMAAGEAARGAVLYVTLEPCCHQGKTGPCTKLIIEAQIDRVVAAMVDPFPEVAGKGIASLRTAGLSVAVGIGEAQGRRLNAPYLKLVTTGKPYVHAKWAMTLDGKIATHTGDSKWISNDESRHRVHRLRGQMDAIVVGIGTVLCDNPLLTARPEGPRVPARVILDSHGRLPLDSQLAKTARSDPVIVVGNTTIPEDRCALLHAAGCEVFTVPGVGQAAVAELLTELGRRRITNVLVEGGAGVLGSFLDAGEIDEVHIFVSPRLMGGIEAKSAIEGAGVASIARSLSLDAMEVEQIKGDLHIHGWKNLNNPEKPAK